jgi:hypothetical protein
MSHFQKSAYSKELAQNTKDDNELLPKKKDQSEEEVFHQFVKKVKRIPYFKVDANANLKRKMSLIDDSLTLEAKAGANLSVEFKKGKIFVESAFAGLRGVCEKNHRFGENIVNETKRKKLGKIECVIEKVEDENNWGVHKSIRVEIDGSKVIENKENVLIGPRNQGEPGCVHEIGDPDQFQFFDLFKVKTTKGYDAEEFQEAKNFYRENRESIHNGFKKVTTKEMKSAHKNTGEALREYLELPFTID